MIQAVLFLLVIFLCFFVLYILSKQDFVLLRQNISLAQIFDLAFFVFIAAFLVARISFIFNNFAFDLFHFIKFFYLIKFPGFSSLGFFLGGALALYLLFRKKKGLARIFDIFSISFLPIYTLAHILQITSFKLFYIPLIFSLLSILIFYFFIKSHKKYGLRDGSISIIFLMLISIDTFVFQIFTSQRHIFLYSLSLLQIVSIPSVLISAVWFFLNQKTSK